MFQRVRYFQPLRTRSTRKSTTFVFHNCTQKRLLGTDKIERVGGCFKLHCTSCWPMVSREFKTRWTLQASLHDERSLPVARKCCRELSTGSAFAKQPRLKRSTKTLHQCIYTKIHFEISWVNVTDGANVAASEVTVAEVILVFPTIAVYTDRWPM